MTPGTPIKKVRVTITNNLDENPWGDTLEKVQDGRLLSYMGKDQTQPVRFGGLPRATKSGKASVCILTPLAGGTHVITEVTLADFLAVAKKLGLHYGE